MSAVILGEGQIARGKRAPRVVCGDRVMVQPLRTLSRGLEVLRVLNRNNGAGLRVVAAASGLSRGAVHRLLETMVTEGYVRKVSGHYFVQSKVSQLTSGVDTTDWLTDDTHKAIEDLCRTLMWPVSISKPNKLGMETCAATDHLTPLRYSMVPIGTKVPMLSSAAGQAFVAFQPAEARDQLLDVLSRGAEFPEDSELCQDMPAVLDMLASVRHKGIALAKAKNRTAIIAVPIVAEDAEVLGSLTLRYFAASLSEVEAEHRNFDKMREAAVQIAKTAKTAPRPH